MDSIEIKNVFGDENLLAKEISSLWDTWKGAKSEWRSRVEEIKKYVYATSTKETTNVQNEHDHSTHIPKMAQIADNLEANYMAALNLDGDWLRFEGHDQDSEQYKKKRAVLAYIETKNKINSFGLEINKCIRDWIITGNCFGMVDYVNEFHIDPETGERINGYIGPKATRISPDDIEFNPYASSFLHAPKIIRSVKTIAELYRDLEENPGLGYSEEILDIIKKTRDETQKMTDNDVNKYVQGQFDGFGSPSQYYKSGYVEILEFYGDIYDCESTDGWYKNYVITVVDRRHVIRKVPLNTWSGHPYIFHCAWRLRPDNLWGMGPLDNLTGMQYLINHLENARADAFDQMIDADRKIFGDVEIEYRGAAADYYITEGGDVQYLAPDTTILNADFAIQRKEQQMEEYAGAPREAMGIRTPGEKTKFESEILANASSRIFQSKIKHFEENFLEHMVNAEIEIAKRNLNSTDVVRILDDDFGVAEFIKVSPEDLKVSGKLLPIGARHFAQQAALAQNLQIFSQVLQGDQMLQQHFPSERLAKIWEDALGLARLDVFRRFGRITEQLEMQQLMSAAQAQYQQQETVAGQAEADMYAENQQQAPAGNAGF